MTEIYPSKAEVKYAIARAWEKNRDYSAVMAAVDAVYEEAKERMFAQMEADQMAFVDGARLIVRAAE